MYYIFLSHIPRQDTRNVTNECTVLLNTRILNSIIVLLSSRLQLAPKEGDQVVLSTPELQPSHLTILYGHNYVLVFLNITLNYAFFRTHSEYNRNALKKQYATFATLTSPTLSHISPSESFVLGEPAPTNIYFPQMIS